jgi:hypothetical protein
MPFMLRTRTLREKPGPDGPLTLIVTAIGDEVDILDEDDGWTNVKLVAKVGSGWVLKTAVGDTSPVAPDNTIDRLAFIAECWRDGLSAAVIPHYLAGVAQLRSGISNATQGNEIGPFRLTTAEWEAARRDPALGLIDFARTDIQFWDLQCALFAALTHRDLEALKTDLGQQPSAAQLYLAQLIGPKAATAAIQRPDDTIEADLNGVQDADLPIGGLTRPQIMVRYAKYLLDGGSAVKGSVALDRIATDLQTALDAVKDDVIQVGTDILADPPQPEAIINNAKTPQPPPPPPPPDPAGPGPTGIVGAGGLLGTLIGAHEGGKLGYRAFNRGNAGDSAGKGMDFSTMTLAQVRDMQARPKGSANRLFAVGKYQLIPVTMKDAIAKLGLNTSRMLTNDLQETLFRDYLVAIKRPHVKSFITGGGSSLQAAQLDLALEFASVGDPNKGGRSHYGGSGGNRASITLAQTAAALNGERTKYQANLAAGMSASNAWNALSG